jgi:hypothetical protein
MITKISADEAAQRAGYDDALDYCLEDGNDSVVIACCVHGCRVEPDGTCEHGNPSVLLELGYI